METNIDTYMDYLKNNLSTPCMGETGDFGFRNFKTIFKTYKDIKNIVEIGFNRGSSALSFLMLSDETNVVSFDILSRYGEIGKSLEFLYNKFPGRFTYIESKSEHIIKQLNSNVNSDFINNIDMIFIDGDHKQSEILIDTINSIELNPRYILFDDYTHSEHGIGVKIAIEITNLKIINEFDNNGLALTELISKLSTEQIFENSKKYISK